MKISKSKRQLAQLLIEAGVTKFPEGADWAAQDKGGAVCTYAVKPVRDAGDCYWNCKDGGVCSVYGYSVQPIPCWHQTALSREEFDCIVAQTELDADGWIEWGGSPRSPVSKGTTVDVKMQNGTQHFGQLIDDECWSDCWGDANIIAYRLHKPERAKPECCESVMRSIPEPSDKPTIEQLASDYRNKLDYANRKQDEADKANMESDAALAQLEDAIAEIGFAITPLAATEKEPELVITDWRDLRVGDEIELTGSLNPCWKEHAGIEMTVNEVHHDQGDNDDQVDLLGESGAWSLGGNTTWRFIRRP